ncbi:hypothetical protein BDFB_013060 [Asbolus verrucosus]|uniref:YqaJ viral recombinase domain-containing protein n=1 Tax=Asbolus verrucosus TaxID=1661398 RepID=A0A482W9Z9_ASBVE|nr:hypothetical protein BDFB_013060 [Asbolus verrucosus]
MEPNTNTTNIVKSQLYSRASNCDAVLPKPLAYGINNEKNGAHLFQKQSGLKVITWGLIIDAEEKFLTVSPDSLVGLDPIVEVKCSYRF